MKELGESLALEQVALVRTALDVRTTILARDGKVGKGTSFGPRTTEPENTIRQKQQIIHFPTFQSAQAINFEWY